MPIRVLIMLGLFGFGLAIGGETQRHMDTNKCLVLRNVR